ncbi:MAG TPA: DUF72 domain-containing protein [Caulobacteraceae bacterium]|nr:DUF72 domain-containing protein [Caulobacteraceae bacterium]
MAPHPPRIGTAGWAIPREVAGAFPREGTGLERYAARFGALELNSTFYRSHKPATYARWRESTAEDFRFAVKLSKAITHGARLVGCEAQIAAFVEEVRAGLAGKLGPILVQLPPSLAFDPAVAASFFAALRRRWSGAVVCEPRHVSWFEPRADALLVEHQVARVAADPARHPDAARPGGWGGLAYWRLHGSPRMYYSSYDEAWLCDLADAVQAQTVETWVIFDNTTSGAAAANALSLQAAVARAGTCARSHPA